MKHLPKSIRPTTWQTCPSKIGAIWVSGIHHFLGMTHSKGRKDASHQYGAHGVSLVPKQRPNQIPLSMDTPKMSPSTKVAFNIIWWWKWWFCQKYPSDTTLMFQKSQGQPPVGCFRDPVFLMGIQLAGFRTDTPGRLESDRDYHVMVRERCTWASQMTGELWRDVTDDRSVGYVLDDHLRGRGKRWVI